MLDVIYVGVLLALFAGSVFALKMFLQGQGKFTGRND